MDLQQINKDATPSVLNSLLAGSAAGIATDIVLFPIDSIKTRAQSKAGFFRSGGYKGLFRGVGSAALGSAPSGASFFFAYEGVKKCTTFTSPLLSHMVAASVAEAFACVFRIPFEVVKQTAQAHPGMNSHAALQFVIKDKGLFGLVRGFSSMVFREIPFTLIQFPLWEHLKVSVSPESQCPPLLSAICGSGAGGIAAAVTTPLDVVKTRIILMQNKDSGNPYKVMYRLAKEEGVRRLFSGIVPRVIWISIGGFVFLGSYEKAKQIINQFGW